jgi:glycine cleavage system protein P-like pyridoxal-binding family
MIEPTESYSKEELDRFCDAVLEIHRIIREHPQVLNKVPLFTPVDRVDEVEANRKLVLKEALQKLPEPLRNRLSPSEIARMPIAEVSRRILEAAGV